jgi:spermidine/putrescine transport system ATP-binding protein
MRSMIDVQDVSKSFASPNSTEVVYALDKVDLQIADNEFFTLLGPSGCGKTTLLRLIGGFETPTSGRIRIADIEAGPLPPQKRPVNTVFQSYALFPHLTVAENVAFGLQMLGVPKPQVKVRVQEALGLVRLGDYGSRLPKQLSGGQQQRVAVARALAPSPKVLLLDEPLSALDLKLRKEMQSELKRLQRETGITFVLVTHDQEEALAMSDRIAVMSAGRVLQVGDPHEIYERPASRFVADFVGESNLIPGASLGMDPGALVSIRPERVVVSTSVKGRASGTVAAITFLGLDTLCEIDLGGGVKIRSRSRDFAKVLSVGQSVAVDWSNEFERHLLQ